MTKKEQTSECRRGTMKKKARRTARVQELETQIDKHTGRSEDSAATSGKDASKDSANKKASKTAATYPTRKRK